MTELSLRGLRASFEGASFDGLDCDVSGRRIALVGDFRPLFALASGRTTAVQGEARVDGTELRHAVLAGQLGVADPLLHPLADGTVTDWLTAYARLRGEAVQGARELAAGALARLGLDYLGRYDCDRLPPQSLYAVRIALATITCPAAVLVDCPTWTAEAAPVENAVLKALSEHSEVLLCCDVTRQPELYLQCDSAILLGDGGAMTVLPQDHWQRDHRHYSVVALQNHDALVEQLESAGARVLRPSPQGEMWVTLPRASGPEIVTAAAYASGAGLRRLSPLFERPSGE